MQSQNFGEYNFLFDPSEGRRMVFISTAALVADTREKVPLWWCEFPDDDNLVAMCAWVGARRHLWTEWGLLAEQIGFQAFARHIRDLTKSEPLERVTEIAVTLGQDQREIVFCSVLELRVFRPIVRHRFRTPAARRRFMKWFHSNQNFRSVWAMAMTGWLAGPEMLSELLDKLATDPGMKLAA